MPYSGSPISGLPIALLAFTAGATLLQWLVMLPPEWEGADITLVGIIDELPQMRFSWAAASASAGAAVHRRNVDAETETPALGRGSDDFGSAGRLSD